MSPQAGEMLIQEIAPRVRNSLASSVAQVGADDRDELCQDGIAIAASLLASAEARGKQVSGSNVPTHTDSGPLPGGIVGPANRR